MTTPKMFYRMKVPELLDQLQEEDCKLVYDILQYATEELVSFKEAAEFLLPMESGETDAD